MESVPPSRVPPPPGWLQGSVFALSVPLAALETVLVHSLLVERPSMGALQGVVLLLAAIYFATSRVAHPKARRKLRYRGFLLVSVIALFATVILHVRLVESTNAAGLTSAVLLTGGFIFFQLGWATSLWLSETREAVGQVTKVPAAIGTVLFVGSGLVSTAEPAPQKADRAEVGGVVLERFVTPEKLGSAFETDRVGDPSGSSFAHFHRDGQPMRGISIGTREWFGRVRIDSDPLGVFDGEEPPAGRTVLRARDGYVISALEVQADDHVNALRIQFSAFDGVFTSSVDQYWSEWVGGYDRYGPTTWLRSGGAMVVGLAGTSGMVLNSVSLVLEAH